MFEMLIDVFISLYFYVFMLGWLLAASFCLVGPARFRLSNN